MGIEAVDIDIISRQTGIQDKQRIRKVFYKNGKDVSKTILELMNLKGTEQPQEENDVFTNLRTILDEKEKLFHSKSVK